MAAKVEVLGAENMSLRSEISQLKESTEKLRAENSSLMVPLNVYLLCWFSFFGQIYNLFKLH